MFIPIILISVIHFRLIIMDIGTIEVSYLLDHDIHCCKVQKSTEPSRVKARLLLERLEKNAVIAIRIKVRLSVWKTGRDKVAFNVASIIRRLKNNHHNNKTTERVSPRCGKHFHSVIQKTSVGIKITVLERSLLALLYDPVALLFVYAGYFKLSCSFCLT